MLSTYNESSLRAQVPPFLGSPVKVSIQNSQWSPTYVSASHRIEININTLVQTPIPSYIRIWCGYDWVVARTHVSMTGYERTYSHQDDEC